MQHTTNYNLNKPDLNDAYNKANDNQNMDTIDAQMKANADATAAVQTNLNTHIAAADPHPQYALDTEKGAANGIATLDASGTIPDAQIPAGITRDTELSAHTSATTAHGSTSAATANAIMQRDAAGRAKVAAPSAVDDIARKDTVDAHANLTNNPHATTYAQVGAAPTSHTHTPAQITTDANNRFVTDTEKATWNAKQNALGYTPTRPQNGGQNIWVQATQPTALAVGDIWIQT